MSDAAGIIAPPSCASLPNPRIRERESLTSDQAAQPSVDGEHLAGRVTRIV
jgi:hypothetical protein